MSYCMDKYCSEHDRVLVNRLLDELVMHRKCLISVYDGEEWIISKSDDISELWEALGTSGEDHLRVYKQTDDGPELVGWFWLIYNNGSTPEECLCDYTANEFCESVSNIVAPIN